MINAEKLRALLKASGRQTIAVSFPAGIDLASIAKQAATEGREYIEIEGWASTSAKNNYGFRIAPSTWAKASAFARLKANPIVLFNHCCDFPIGTIVSWEPRSDGLWVRLRIRYNAILPTQEKVGDVVADGTLRALSLGIDINEFEAVEVEDRAEVVVTDATIGEITLCAVPSDPGAVTDEDLMKTLSATYKQASIADEEGSTMWKMLAAKYGMDPEKVTEADVMAEYTRRETLGAQAIAGLGLSATFTPEQLTAALAARDPEKLNALTLANATLTAQNLVNLAVIEGRIAPLDEDTKAFALSLATENPTQYAKWIALQKPVQPDTRTVTGPGAGTALGGRPKAGGPAYITQEDTEICLSFGAFKTVEEMDVMAETAPNVALGWVLGQNFGPTAEDKKVLATRKQFDLACGIQR